MGADHFLVQQVMETAWRGALAPLGAERGSRARAHPEPAQAVGLVERAPDTASWQLGVKGFIAVWLALEVAGNWLTWSGDRPGELRDGSSNGTRRLPARRVGASGRRIWRGGRCSGRELVARGRKKKGGLTRSESAVRHPLTANAPGPIRTGDLLLRRQTLYPAELRALEAIKTDGVLPVTQPLLPGPGSTPVGHRCPVAPVPRAIPASPERDPPCGSDP